MAWLGLAWWSRQPGEVTPWLLLAVLGAAWASTLAAFWLVRKRPARAWRHVLLWAVIFRVIGLCGEPVLEDDQYRYLWDAWVFAQQGTPYGQPPERFFGDPGIPEPFQEILGEINHPDVPTIYGPVSELLFLAGYFIQPGETLPIRMLLTAAELGGILVLANLVPPSGGLLYAWCPLLIQETAFTGHPDALGVLFLLIAIRLGQPGRVAKHASAAVAAAFAAGSRLLAFPLVPFLLGGSRSLLTSAAIFSGTLGLLYLPFWLQGHGESGLFAFAAGWEFNSFGYALIAALFPDSLARTVSTISASVLVLVLFLDWRRDTARPIPGDLAVAGFLFFSPVINPWYLLWLAPFVAMRPSIWGVTVLAAVPLSYLHGLHVPEWNLPPYEHPAAVRMFEWGLVTCAVLLSAARTRRGSR